MPKFQRQLKLTHDRLGRATPLEHEAVGEAVGPHEDADLGIDLSNKLQRAAHGHAFGDAENQYLRLPESRML
jgi:hypothetical protein